MKSGINIRKVLNKLNEIDFNVAKDRYVFGEIYKGILRKRKAQVRAANSILHVPLSGLLPI